MDYIGGMLHRRPQVKWKSKASHNIKIWPLVFKHYDIPFCSFKPFKYRWTNYSYLQCVARNIKQTCKTIEEQPVQVVAPAQVAVLETSLKIRISDGRWNTYNISMWNLEWRNKVHVAVALPAGCRRRSARRCCRQCARPLRCQRYGYLHVFLFLFIMFVPVAVMVIHYENAFNDWCLK